MIECLVVGIGGFIGSVMRYLIGLLPLGAQDGFPVKTFTVNILGAFVIGLISALAAKQININPRLVLFLKTGICGGFTTFSTFALETGGLMKNGHIGIAVMYVILSVALGAAAVLAAEVIVKY